MVDQRPHLADVGIMMEYDDVVGRESDIEFDAIGALGDGEFERLDAVVGGVCRGAPVCEH